MIPEGMRDVLPPETARLRAVEDRAARPLRRLRLRRGAHPVAGVRRDARGRRRRHARRRLPPARRAGPRAHGAHRHDRPGGAHGRRPLRRRAAAAALLLRGPEHPPVGAAARPGRRVPAGRRRAAGPGLGRGRRRVRHAALRRARGARPPRLHASRSASVAFQRALIDSLGLPADDRARRSRRRWPTATTRCVESIAGNADVDVRRAQRRSGASSSSAAARRCSGRRASWRATTSWRPPSSASARVRDLVEDAGLRRRGWPSTSA